MVSVIVPVYNKAPHLAECLDSILTQSLHALEVVCVDDASTDGSGDVLNQYGQRDARITVIRHERNRGAAAARNTGLEAARGEFVQFTDADDQLTPDALRLLVEQARADDVDVVRGGLVGFHTQAPDKPEPLVSPQRRRRFRPLEHRASWVPWWHTTYLFSRQFLLKEDIRYPELVSGEDPVFLARVLTRVLHMSSIPDVIYRYRLAPLADKGRQTALHAEDYVRHIEALRALYLDAHPPAWHDGMVPALRPELEAMQQYWPLTQVERRTLDADIHRLFDRSPVDGAGAVRKLLFLYNVCGLGGVEMSIANKMEALRTRGVEVRALFQSYLGEGGHIAAQQPGFVVQGDAKAQRRYIRDWQPDAIVVVDSPWLIDVAVSSGVGCPILFESHLSERNAAERRVQGGISDPRISTIIVPSRFNRAFLAEFGVDPRRVRVVPNPLDTGRFHASSKQDLPGNLGLPTDRRLILFVGRLEPNKNPIEFVRVAAAMTRQDPGIHCVMVGAACDPPDYADTVHAEAAAAGVDITYREYIAYDDMSLYYSAAAMSGGCLLATSLNESQPMNLLEAMACGCPVVSSDVGGVREIIEDGRTGTLYDCGDVPGAVTGLARTLHDAEYRAKVVRLAQDKVLAQHGLEQCASAYADVLEEAVSAGTAAPSPSGVVQAIGEGRPPLLQRMTLAGQLAGLFATPELVGVQQTVEPYKQIAPRVVFGFQTTATVRLEMRPKEDFSRSPDYCLSTLVIDFQGPSRWLTIETPITWNELDSTTRYQFGLYGRPDREMSCRVVLRLPRGEKDHEDSRLCDLVLKPEGRSAHGHGEFRLPEPADVDRTRKPRVLFFIDPSENLRLELDYLTAWFA